MQYIYTRVEIYDRNLGLLSSDTETELLSSPSAGEVRFMGVQHIIGWLVTVYV
jgi:hypothetical protein